MSEELFRGRIHDALNIEPPDPALRARIITSLPVDSRVRPRPFPVRLAPQLIAVLVAVAIAVSLVYIGRVVGQQHPTPVWTGAPCSLPVADENGYPAGFVSYPNGTYAPTAAGQTGITYDAAMDKWVPVPPNQISPDGRRYATSEHITDVASGKVTFVLGITGVILKWDASGIYYRAGQGYTQWELWVYDPTTGQRRMLSGPGPRSMEWILIAGGAAWGYPSGGYNSLERLDLATGLQTTWYAGSASGTIWIPGADSQGHPVLMLGHYVMTLDEGRDPIGTVVVDRLILVASPTKVLDIGTLPRDDKYYSVTVVADRDAIWFSMATHGIWLYTPQQGLHKFDFRAPGLNNPHVAGPCL